MIQIKLTLTIKRGDDSRIECHKKTIFKIINIYYKYEKKYP